MDTDRKPFLSRKLFVAAISTIVLAIAIGVLVTTSGIPGFKEKTPMPPTNGTEIAGTGDEQSGEDYEISIGLSSGQPQQTTPIPMPVATGEPLTPEEVDNLFSRLPDLPLTPEEQTTFNYPVELLPPPKTGVILKEKFPYSEYLPTPEVETNQPLQVVRFAPEGEIPIAPFISVTFNQAMVPLGTLSDLAAKDVPVKIQPDLPGTWRWLGTKTLTFEYDSTKIDRLPKATSYTVTVPAGTKSESGAMLAAPVTWKFSTPPPVVVTMYPQGIPQPLQTLIFIGFDQRINPAAVLKTIQLYAGNASFDLRLATEDEISADTQISRFVENAQEGRWLVFKAVKLFPADTSVSITVGPGTPSAEGPMVTTSAQSYGFSTYAPLRIVNHGCYWGNNQCVPLSPFYIEFNNPLDEVTFSEEMITASPEIPGMSVNLYGNTIAINGETKGQTTYTITVSANLRDTFGQKLGKDVRVTYEVGKAEPRLFSSDDLFVTLDPALKDPVFSYFAINYKKVAVKVYSVQPGDWNRFTKYYREWRKTDNTLQMPGTLVFDKTVVLNIPDDTLSELNIELKPYLKNGFGQFIVKIEPPEGMFESEQQKWQRYSQTIQAWVQVTHIGVDAFTDHSDMIAWATDLRDGSPVSGVSITPNVGSRTYTTGQDGTVRFGIPDGANYLVATKGADTAMLLHSPYAWDDRGWTATTPTDSLRWYVFDDRQMYRPGEEVHIKGWLRRIGGTQMGDVSLVGGDVTAVTYQLTDPQGNAIGTGDARVNALGGFDFSFTIPETVNLGYAQLYFSAIGNLSGLDGNSFNHSFQIQEFRRPEFEVTAKNETTGPYFAGGQALLSVEAKYYAGGALPNADVTWEVTTTPGTYSPPNWPDFIFGEWRPWWRTFDYWNSWQGEDAETETFTGFTDSSGVHYLNLEFEQQGNANKKPMPMSVVAQATVMDVNRQAWSRTTTLLVHPASLYVGLRTDRYFVEKDTPIKVDFIVTDLDGKAISGQSIVITAARMEWKRKMGQWIEEEVDVQICNTVSKSEPDSCSFKTPIGGSYRISAIVTDDLGRTNQTAFNRWVSGGQRPPSRDIEQEEVTLIPDKENYQPGDTAQILVQSPFSPAEGLLTVSRSGFIYSTRFQVKDGSTTLSIPIKAEHTPNLNIQVDLVGSAERIDDQGNIVKNTEPRPAFATAQLNLNIPPLQRTLALDVIPEISQLEPGGETLLRVSVEDADGTPVSNAELAVVVVDEAILALTDYQITDPISIFYSERGSLVQSIYGRSSIILANPESLIMENSESVARDGLNAMMPTMTAGAPTEAPAAMEKSGTGGAQQNPIDVRTNFNPLATFAPSVRTGSNGKASITIKVPDNLTRYRIMVVAVDDTGRQFGIGESNLTARLPLMVRPSAPRFLNFGDRIELPVILQNQTNEPMIVEVVARATNLKLAQSGFRVTVPANDRIEVRFPASAQMAGTARVQIAAVSGTYADAAVVEIPVYTPATTEAFATYGVIDDGAIVQSIMHPNGVFPQYGGLEINTSSTALQALTDAVLYLVKYPFECSEQLASRILAIAALRDVLTAFEAADLPSPEELQASISSDLKTLEGLQNYDGGFPYWRRGFESIPFNTIHVAHALYQAERKGFKVSEEMQQGTLNYLANIESHYPNWYSQKTRWTLSAYALYVRNLTGDRDAQKAQSIINEAGLENLSMEAIGWLWPVIDNETSLVEIRRFVNNHVVETAGAANFTTGYDEQTYLLLSSDRRTDAILLDALIEDYPQSDLIPKVVNGLLAHRTKGRWGNTQENVFVLLALDRYFNTYEFETPDFVARIWLGDTYAGSSEFSGYTTEQHEMLIPMDFVLSETSSAGGTESLIISKEGPGRLYYRLGLSYAPTDLNLKPLDMGFVILRRYEAVDDPEDVTQDSEGVWHIKAGVRVKVHITMVADNRRYHVALVDPLPAGLEIINPALSVAQNLPQDDPFTRSYGWWWWGTWYEHQNLRDDRAEAFTSLLWDGVYEYTYFARATTPGTFIVPPTKAEEMYSPEVFGRSSSDWLIVK